MAWRKQHNAEYFHIMPGNKRPWSLVDHSLAQKIPTTTTRGIVAQALKQGLPAGPSEALINQYYALQVSPHQSSHISLLK
jgi:hypothetical protein